MQRCVNCGFAIPQQNYVLHQLRCQKHEHNASGQKAREVGSKIGEPNLSLSKSYLEQRSGISIEGNNRDLKDSVMSSCEDLPSIGAKAKQNGDESKECSVLQSHWAQVEASDHLFALSVARTYEDKFEQVDLGTIHAIMVQEAEHQEAMNSLPNEKEKVNITHTTTIGGMKTVQEYHSTEDKKTLTSESFAAINQFDNLLKDIETMCFSQP